MQELVLGIDLGGTTTAIGLVDNAGNIQGTHILSTADFDIPQVLISEIAGFLSSLPTCYPQSRLTAIGIGAPAANFMTGTIESPANLPWPGSTYLRELFVTAFRVPVFIDNDANVAAYGELLYGAGINDFITVTLGTGIGGGVVVNGKIVHGHTGFAGELGHMIVKPGGRVHPGTGIRGTLETYASNKGLMMTVKELLHKSKAPSKLRTLMEEEMVEVDTEKIYNYAMAGDEIAQMAFKKTGRMLGIAFANYALFSAPEAIIVFGGLAKAGDLLLTPAKIAMEQHLPNNFKDRTKLLYSALPGGDAAILGAAALARSNS